MTTNSTTGVVTIDPDQLARKIEAIAAQSLDPDSAERLASIAQMLLTTLQDYHRRSHEAWVLVGMCDYFLETFRSQPVAAQRRQAERLRGEIKKATGL